MSNRQLPPGQPPVKIFVNTYRAKKTRWQKAAESRGMKIADWVMMVVDNHLDEIDEPAENLGNH